MRRIIITVLVLAMLSVIFTGCSSKYEGTLVVGVMDNYPPMGYRNASGELVGFEVDLARAVAEIMGADIEFYITSQQDMLGTLKSRDVDILISSVSYSEEKQKYAYIDFSIPYLQNGEVIVTTHELASTITTLEGLSGMVVGVEAASKADKMVSEQKDVEFTLIRYESLSVCIAALKVGQMDCVICDMPAAIDIVERYPDKFVISSAKLTDEPLSIALGIGNENLQKQLNDAILELRENGKLSELSIKYLGEDYTQNLDDDH